MTIDLADVDSPEALVDAVYRLLSGRADTPRDWSALRLLCAPGARLTSVSVADGHLTVDVLDFDAYERSRTPMLAAGDFYELDVGQRVERFGDIAHVWSAYEAHRSLNAAPFMRGVSSFQLLRRDERWWILAVLWQSAPADAPVRPDPPR